MVEMNDLIKIKNLFLVSNKENINNALLIENDYQLYEALNVLKGLSIYLKKVK